MPYREETTVSEKEFMKQANGILHKTGGITINSDSAGVAVGGTVKAGTAFYYNGTDYVPVAAETTAAEMEGAGLVAHDVEIYEGGNLAGLVIAGVPDESKCTGVTDAFKEATSGRLMFNL